MAPSAKTTIQEFESYSLKHNSLSSSQSCHDGPRAKIDMVKHALLQRVDNIDTDICEPGEEDAFFVADVGEVYRQHLRWKMNLKRVKPHYGKSSVKCNPDAEVLRLLAALGAGFDCASKAEIEQILNLGVGPSRIIYAQPCKTKSHVRYAAQQNVKQMTFDNADELYKIHNLYPEAELFLRILTDDSSSMCRLSQKFGASLDCSRELLNLAKHLNLHVVGVSFHVGSGASDPECFAKAIRDSRHVFDQAADIGFDLKTLDVGGGFSGDTFETMAHVLSEALDEHFPPSVRVIGEPGRYYVASAFTLACNVIARREIQDPATRALSYMLYLNDGAYGNFSSIIFDHQHPSARILRKQGGDNNVRATDYSIWGPTCDGIDRISENCTLRGVIDVGDWLYFEEMGAYTMCSATRFNGFTDNHQVVYISSEPGAAALLGY